MAILDVWQDVWADVWQDVWGAAEVFPSQIWWNILLTHSINGTPTSWSNPAVYKNVEGQYAEAYAFGTDGLAVSGDEANITGQLAKNDGALTAFTNSCTEIGSTGVYRWLMTQEESNCNKQLRIASSSTPGVSVVFLPPVIFPRQVNYEFLEPGIDSLVIGDDYKDENNRAFQWTVPIPTGISLANTTVKFGGKGDRVTWNTAGSFVDNGDDTMLITAPLDRNDLINPHPGKVWLSVELYDSLNDNEITVVRGSTKLIEKFT